MRNMLRAVLLCLVIALAAAAAAAAATDSVEVQVEVDEFAGLDDYVAAPAADDPAADPTPPRPPSPPASPRDPLRGFRGLPRTWEEAVRRFWPDALALLFVLIYGAVFYHGRGNNRLIAQAWMVGLVEFLQSQFAEIRPAYAGKEWDGGGLLCPVSPHEFSSFLSGRRNCSGAALSLTLRHRQDLFGALLSPLLSPLVPLGPRHDTASFEIVLPETLDLPLVLCVCQARDAQAVRGQLEDVRRFTGVLSFPRLGPELAVMAETPDAANGVIQGPVLQALKSMGDLLDVLHITDQYNGPVLGFSKAPRKVLRMVVRLPMPWGNNVDAMMRASEQGVPLLSLAVQMVDALAVLKLSPPARKTAVERRRELEAKAGKSSVKAAHRQQMEQAQARKAERLRKEREEYESLTPEQKARRDAKDEKKKLKQLQKGRQGRVKVVK